MDDKMPFGPYRGRLLCHVPRDYLRDCLRFRKLKRDLADSIERELRFPETALEEPKTFAECFEAE